MSWTKCNRQKKKQLGLNPSTATARLRKMVLFDLVKKVRQDSCFRCGKKIRRYEDLSIDHKKPWLHVNPDLFWDLDNITFSHTKCNKPDRKMAWGKPITKR